MDLSFRTITFEEYAERMLELWDYFKSVDEVRKAYRSYGMQRYTGDEAARRALLIPVAGYLGNTPVCWTAVSNISDTAVRLRGLLVAENYRGQGIVHELIEYALGLWPRPWNRCIGCFRLSTVPVFSRRGWRPLPGYAPRSVRVRQQALPYQAQVMYLPFNPESEPGDSRWPY